MTLQAAILSFAGVAILITIIPGLDSVIVLRSAISQGRGHAYATALGVCSGALAWGVAAAVGASAVLAASELGFTVLKVAGAAYMVWLGVSMIWRSRSAHGLVVTTSEPPRSRWSSWRRGLLTNLLNPKVGVFYLATIPQFMAAGVSHLAMGVILALVHDVIGLVWFTAIIVLAGRARRLFSGVGFTRVVDRLTGTVLVGLGIRLATAHR
jgi:threonine/homoserine/homoserine lactone efflux protein